MIIHAIHGFDVNKIKVKRIDHTVIRNSIGLGMLSNFHLFCLQRKNSESLSGFEPATSLSQTIVLRCR